MAITAEQWLTQLGQFGRTDDTGVTRPVYTKPWVDAVSWLHAQGRANDMDVSVDAQGNSFLTYQGTESDTIVAAGSHIDSVVKGGRYDGAFGVCAAFLAATRLHAKYGAPKKTLTVVAISEEDASRFPTTFSGSKHYAQVSEVAPDLVGNDGVTFADARAQALAALPAGTKHQEQPLPSEWFELHIEQGPVLAATDTQLGVVSSICELKRFNVTLTGETNHAGTTPQHLRHDPLKAAARIITTMDTYTAKIGEPLVFTVGSFQVTPGASNAIPGQVVFSIDVRHPKLDVVEAFEAALRKTIAAETAVEIKLDSLMEPYPEVQMDPRLQKQFEEICQDQGYSYKVMPSGAGHDTQIMNRKVPTAMLFVPSRNGISHSPQEFTAADDLERGIAVLEAQLYKECY